jgi:hypothetical protein
MNKTCSHMVGAQFNLPMLHTELFYSVSNRIHFRRGPCILYNLVEAPTIRAHDDLHPPRAAIKA